MRLMATRQPQRGDLSQRRLPLDFLPFAEAGFAVRRLRWDYLGFALRVRRSSDNAELNIGFNANGDLDTATLLAFCGAASGFVTTWYDQSLFARHATQTNPASQPRIVNAGVLGVLNGRPGLGFLDRYLDTPLVTLGSVTVVGQTVAGDNWNSVILNTASGNRAMIIEVFSNRVGAFTNQFWYSGYDWNDAEAAIFTATRTSIGKNGAPLLSTGVTVSPEFSALGANGQCSTIVSEVVVFSAALSTSDRQLLERNQGSYYGIAVA